MSEVFDPKKWLYEGVVLTELSAEGETLNQVEVYESEIHEARLSGATLKRWVFEDCLFRGCDLSNVKWEQCTFTGCKFIECRLVGSDWRAVASLTAEVSFIDCDLSYSQLSGVCWRGARFERTRCLEVDFNRATLTRAQWVESSVEGATFEEANLSEADVRGAIYERFNPDETTLTSAKITIETAIRLAEDSGLIVDQADR